MIYIGSISNINVSNYDETWCIVRSLKTQPFGTLWVKDLSPSTELFYNYLSLKKAGEWNTNSFMEKYIPVFIREIKNNPNAKYYLNYIYKNQDKDIYLACYCSEEELCHRSIIAGLLQGVGVQVYSFCKVPVKDYSKYYTIYKTIDLI